MGDFFLLYRKKGGNFLTSKFEIDGKFNPCAFGFLFLLVVGSRLGSAKRGANAAGDRGYERGRDGDGEGLYCAAEQ